MPWRRLIISYGWIVILRELQASPRWSAEAKARALVAGGVAISLPVTLGTVGPYLYWLITGNGPWRKYGFSSSVVVNPFPRNPPAEIRAALYGFAKTRAPRSGSRAGAPSE